jgi:ParB-like chromosome segregation protein Spo0J
MKTQTIKINKLKLNNGQVPGLPKNPRFIRNDRYKALVKSIQDHPEMLELREVLAYDTGTELVVIGGNMRLRACRELGISDVPAKVLLPETPVEKLRAYTVKDNVAFGEWDMDLLANEWELPELEDFGFSAAELGIFEPGDADDQGKLDELDPKMIKCPHCGEEFDSRQS